MYFPSFANYQMIYCFGEGAYVIVCKIEFFPDNELFQTLLQYCYKLNVMSALSDLLT